ncbi:uncharacterized protein LOC106666625 isoform X2 [Cimex lectularius]|uniref:Uncharacterized protein n=1 Tax=Cimex lectularius TaxID=79782 RepID=A0A8I6SHG4_CIMLE|nr:uncharacterized protein LOC106666625 isoform X2 [Cimex lectularius]
MCQSFGMAKSQQDQTWPFRPPMNFYPQQVYNLPYQHPGLCTDTCCQQPSIPRQYRSIPYPPLSYSQSNSFSRQASQPISQYVPVNPYTTSRTCSTQHQRHSYVHRPIPQSRYDYDYYRTGKPRVALKKPNTHDYMHGNNQYPSNQFPPCNLYQTPEVESALPNIDVRQFLATWQDKDEDVAESSDHLRNSGCSISFNTDPYEPLDCTKRNDTLVQNCNFNKPLTSPYYNKNDASMDATNPPMTYVQPYMNNSSIMSGITSNANIDHLGDTQQMGQMPEKDVSFIPFERSIEKICNPRIFKTPPAVNSMQKTMPPIQCAMTDNVCQNNLKEFKTNSQYHLSASLENDDLFDDINRKKEEKQKNIVHPLSHEEPQNDDNSVINEKSDLSQIVMPVNPTLQDCNVSEMAFNVAESFPDELGPVELKNDESQLLDKTKTKFVQNQNEIDTKSTHSGKYKLQFQAKNNCDSQTPGLGYDEPFNMIPSTDTSIDHTRKDKIEQAECDMQMYNKPNMNNKDILNSSTLHTVTERIIENNLKESNCFVQGLTSNAEKLENVQHDNMEVSSEDIELSLSSGDSLIDDVSINMNELNNCVNSANGTSIKDPTVKPTDNTLNDPVLKYSNESVNNLDISKINCVLNTSEIKTYENEFSMDNLVTDQKESFEGINENAGEDSGLKIEKNQETEVQFNEILMENEPSESEPVANRNDSKLEKSKESNGLQKIAFSYQDLNLSEDSSDSSQGEVSADNLMSISSQESEKNLSKDVKILNASETNLTREKIKSELKSCNKRKLISNSSHNSFKPNALLYWKIKHHLIFKCVIKKKKNKERNTKTISNKRKSYKKVASENNLIGCPKTLDILTECSKTNCEVNCVIYQTDSHSYRRCEVNSILADEVHISGKCQDNINNNYTGLKSLEEYKSVQMESLVCEQLQRSCIENELSASFIVEPIKKGEVKINEPSQVLAGDSSTKLRNIIANFFTAGKAKIDPDLTCSFQEPEMVKQIIIKGAEEIGSTKWHFKNIKTISQKESIKCSLTWDNIFKTLYEQNDVFQKDSLELGPAKIHLTLSPRNGKMQGKCNNSANLNIFKAVINTRKLILKRSDASEERIPKMVIKKSEGEGYRSFIKDVCINSNNCLLKKQLSTDCKNNGDHLDIDGTTFSRNQISIEWISA